MPNLVTRIDKFKCPKINASVNVKVEIDRLIDEQGVVVGEHKSLKECSEAEVCGVAQHVSKNRIFFDWSDCEYKKQMI